MTVQRPIVLSEQANLGRFGVDIGIAAAEVNFERLGEVEILAGILAELKFGVGEGAAAADLVFLERQLRTHLEQMAAVEVDAGEA